MSGITIRFATAEDIAGIAAVGPADPRMSGYFEGRHHPQQALSPRAGFVALDGDQLIGYIAGHLTTRHHCDGEIQYLFVAPSYRRRGVATAFVRFLAEWFVSHNARKICIAIADDSPPEARPFYEHLGAKPLRRFWFAFADISKSMRRPEA